MSSGDAVRAERLRKLEVLKAAGMEGYPVKVPRTHTVSDFTAAFTDLEAVGTAVALVGRVMSVRGQGGILFADIFDGTEKTQLVLRKEEIDEALFDLFAATVDQGDFISATGTAFTTKRGEKSLAVKAWRMATKSLLPLPSQWYGIKDEESRYRLRYLDMLLDPHVRMLAERRSTFWNTMRTFLLERGFIEVETPVLETSPGGADARPFVTHHNALDMEVYLRISAGELWQKKLLVAGLPKIFEIGRIFRNEGISNEHLQDYTQMEFYQAFSDYEEGMALIQDLYRTIATKVYGTTKFTIKGHEVDLADSWARVDYCETIEKHFALDPLTCTEAEASAVAQKVGIEVEVGADNKSRIIDLLWKSIRKGIAGPAFLVGVPAYLEPLAKRDPARPEVVERFQVLIAGSEMGKGYSELNDPIDQRARFEAQQTLRDQGDEEAQRLDDDYITALEYGMPPAFGFGVSERLLSFLEDKSVREAQLFPLLRPKQGDASGESEQDAA